MDLTWALKLTQEEIDALPHQDKIDLAVALQGERDVLRQRNQLLFYEPASLAAREIHFSKAKEIIVSGGNRSSKTETAIVEGCIQATGIIPYSLEGLYENALHPPIRIRIICQSFTTVLEPIIKPKLQWWKWNGREPQGCSNGHWGWIPPDMLIDGDWGKSWSEKNRALTLVNGTVFQFMSHTQEVQDFSGGSFHLIILDEGPKHAVYRENLMRTVDTGGRLITSMTPPDEEAASWEAAWVFDELYTKGLPGPNKDPEIDAFTLFTESNRTLDLKDIELVSKGLSETAKQVRLRGQFLHIGGRIYPTYSDRLQMWCFTCNQIIYRIESDDRCSACNSFDIKEFAHFIEPFDAAYTWPAAMFLDPHPRKPNCISWVTVAPDDSIFQVAELEIDDDPFTVWTEVKKLEEALGLRAYRRYMDPNMAESPSSSAKAAAGRTVRQEFDRVGFRCALADDNRETARSRLRTMMKPDKRTGTPLIRIFTNCKKTNFQLLRYSWDEWTRYSSDKKDPKPTPREKHDDFPTLLGYMANAGLTYKGLKHGGDIIRRRPGEVMEADSPLERRLRGTSPRSSGAVGRIGVVERRTILESSVTDASGR